MGIILHLVDQRSPRGFTQAFSASHRVNRILRIERPLMQPPLLRPRPGTPPREIDPRWEYYSLVGPNDTMALVVRDIMHQYGSGPRWLDAIRIEAHGRLPGAFRPADRVQFGAGMEASDVAYFYPIATLWSRPYSGSPVSPTTAINQALPRIEFHSCQIVHGCDAMLQALANASGAYVFASSADQDVDLRRGQDRYAMEPPVFRFHPGGPGAQLVA